MAAAVLTGSRFTVVQRTRHLPLDFVVLQVGEWTALIAMGWRDAKVVPLSVIRTALSEGAIRPGWN